MGMLRFALIVALIGFLALPAAARGAASFTADTSLGDAQTDSASATSTGLAPGTLAPARSTVLLQESALANAGGLRASARATANVLRPAQGPGFSFLTSAYAAWTFDDFVITGPASDVAGPVNLTLDGTFGTGIINLSNLFTAILTSSASASAARSPAMHSAARSNRGTS